MERLTPEEEQNLYRMVQAIYNSMNLDGHAISPVFSMREKADLDVAKWRAKQKKDEH